MWNGSTDERVYDATRASPIARGRFAGRSFAGRPFAGRPFAGRPFAGAWLAGVLLLASVAVADPRIPLVDRQVERNHTEALSAVERALEKDPQDARRLGLNYLRGHLLLLLDRRQEALQAFATSMGATPELEAYSRFRLAREQEDLGHPEVAAGLVAPLLGSSPPRSLVDPAMRLLERTISKGGDCRLLAGLNRHRFNNQDRRRLTLVRAVCAERGGDPAAAETLLQLLEEKRGDDVALSAAERIAQRPPAEKGARGHLLLGLAFYEHREFATAVQHLARALVRLPSATDVTPREAFDCRYALARSHFWQERFDVAAASFGALVNTTRNPTRRAQVTYQRARSLELDGLWKQAADTFDQALRQEPTGRWADGSLMSTLRLRWRMGGETEALAALEALIAGRKLTTASRALLFLASSDLVRGRADRAGSWLARASQLNRVPEQEIDYWQGRLEEAGGKPGAAVGRYIAAARENPYHPFGRAALERLAGDDLGPVARARASRLAGSTEPADLYASWLLLGDSEPQGRRARHRLEALLWADQKVIPYLRLTREPTADWPLWQATLKRPEEMLLALGIFEEGASVVLRHFPVAQPGLAFTGSIVLAQSGETKRALYIAEIMGKRIPDRVPSQLLPTPYRRLLFPFGYSYLILSESDRFHIDPNLLAAIIREESRFDPRAFSGASARGLTQFVLPTARRVAKSIGLDSFSPQDLERPEIAITLGAAYLRELSERLPGSVAQAVAAYNAGEPQAELWRRYCLSGEDEEFLTKVAFRETRGYLTKVLTSLEHYRELYPSPEGDDSGG